MKATDIDRFSIPDVQDTEPIEMMVARMRKGITLECSGLLRRTRIAHAASRAANPVRIRAWESRITRIIETNASTFSLEELERLQRECRMLSDEIGRFEA